MIGPSLTQTHLCSWVDYFNLMQLVVLLLALGETMVLHRLEHLKMNDLVVVFDRTFRVLMPCFLWPSLVVGSICIGVRFRNTGILIISLGSSMSFGIGGLWIYRTHVKVRINRRKAVEAAELLTPETDDRTYFQVRRA